MDDNRIPLNGSEHLAVINDINQEIESSGKRICTLYIFSNNPKGTIFGSATFGVLTPMYGFQVLIMPRFVGNTSQEMELQIKELKKERLFHPESLYMST